MDTDIKKLSERIEKESAFIEQLTTEIGKVIVGQRNLIDKILVGLLSDGHILIEGVPGLAKTLMVKTLSDCISTKFQRIQFTPDLLPADLIGTLVYNPKDSSFKPRKGPLFANLILADEINRAPAKVQSALLEAMQERQITIGDTTYPLDEPFLVMATQNPIEQEGTYPLPEAQIDRFMLKLIVDYPSMEEERAILERMTSGEEVGAKPVITPKDIINARKLLYKLHMDEKIKDYILNIVFATRFPEKYGIDDLKGMIAYGASPRASIYLTLTSKAYAFIKRRGYVIPEDIKSIGYDVLRHRIIPTYEAEAEDMTTDDILRKIFDEIEVP
ncbi:MAG: MoxR family ATPase [Candidatus Cloacimonadota bacterium]|nr:MAG: MoxR family ATPase [Candidatus Cloacimonadota bacterium]